MTRHIAFGVILGVFVGLGKQCMSVQVDVSMERQDSGFFMKPMFRDQEIFSLNSLERPFVVSNPGEPVKVKVKYGPFTAEEYVPVSLLHSRNITYTSTVKSYDPLLRNIDISAHLVSRTITQERPQVSVLFHASPMLHTEQNKIKTTRSPLVEVQWCVQMSMEHKDEEMTSVCVLSLSDSVCVADVMVPGHWWDAKQSTTVNVYYKHYMLDKSGRCRPQASDIIPDDDSSSTAPMPDKAVPGIKILVSSVTLTYGQITYQELKEDQHILVYIPQKSFYPGSKFTVPIKLQAESDLEIFVIKVKARHGIRIVDAIPNDPSKWTISLELNHKNKGAMVTAAVADIQKYSKTDRVQKIFDFVFEVEEAASGEDRGRLSFTLAYEMTSSQREKYGSVENKVVARLDIQQDNTIAIVPVIKSTELINIAMLTGKMVTVPMRIYSLSQGAKVTDITSTTTCHSGNEHVLKVSQSCNLVYLDGSETAGAASVSVIAKYGRHSEFLFFRVWAPTEPLEVHLSDDKLSQIKGWKVPTDKGASRSRREVDFGLLTHPDLLFQDDGLRKEDLDATCQLRYQQADVNVYTGFTAADDTKRDKHDYYVHRKALFRVTDHVLDRLRVADASVARLMGSVVEGLKPGRTEIQVVSRAGRVLGTGDVRVGHGKVQIDKLEVDVVSAVDLTLDLEPQMDGVLKANVHRETQFTTYNQEGILDIKLWFDDGTSTPLHQISPSDYVLETGTLNNHVAGFKAPLSEDMPRVVALGPGKGDLLKVSLELREACQRKKSRNIASSFGFIFVKFQEEKAPLQSDSGHYSNNRANERYGQQVPADNGKMYVSKEDLDRLAKNKGYHDQEVKHDSIGGIPINDFGFAPKTDDGTPNHEAQQQLVLGANGMTPLEIGMYVLLAIFCMAIVVFMVNCMIFVARYKRKRKPQETKDPIANVNDWVWIGRATLERNAISTTCSQALMSDADFNGNHSNGNLQLLSPPVETINPAAESASNRNSVISTYKGSECSIRITANPLLDNPENHGESDILEEDSTSTASSKQSVKPPPVPPHAPKPHEQLARLPQELLAKTSDMVQCSAPSARPRDVRASVPITAPNKPLPAPPGRASCPVTFGFSSDSDDMCSLGRDYFGKGSPDPGPSREETPVAKSAPSALPSLPPKPTSLAAEDSDEGAYCHDDGLEGACAAIDTEDLRQRRQALQVALVESIKAQQDSANGNSVANGNLSEAEWDYEAMGLTYDQLMDYFDNLKESTA